MNSSLTDPYSQASLTFYDTEDHFGADTQPTDFDYADFTLPSQASQLPVDRGWRHGNQRDWKS